MPTSVSYDDLLDTTTPLYRAVRGSVTQQCSQQLDGLTEVSASAHLDVDLLPMISDERIGRRAWDPVPIESWDAGDRGFLCTYQQSTAGTTSYLGILDGAFPTEARSCLSGEVFVSCDTAHDTERIALFIVDRAVDSGQLQGTDAIDSSGQVALEHGQWTALDDICQRYLNVVSQSPPDGVFGVADTYPELYPNEFGSYNVMCLARSPFGTSADDMVISTSSVYDD